MRDQLGVLLVEGADVNVAVQLFADVSGVEKAFINLAGSPTDPPRRATLISLRYNQDDVQTSSSCKVLPILESAENRPDGYVLGEGPVKFSKPD